MIREAPPVVVFHLKRFEYDLSAGTRVKVNDRFEFPFTVDIAPLMEEPAGEAIYHLRGVVLHSGTGFGGHYVSLVKIGNEWYELNDHRVT